jgi:hypothetical protein
LILEARRLRGWRAAFYKLKDLAASALRSEGFSRTSSSIAWDFLGLLGFLGVGLFLLFLDGEL